MNNRLNALGINHVVVLTLENRGFDHVMGWLYNNENNEDVPANIIQMGGQEELQFLGLTKSTPNESKEFTKNLANLPFTANGNLCPPIKGARSPKTPSYNPGEHFVHIMAQMYGGSKNTIDWADPVERNRAIEKIGYIPMNGYLLDYAETVKQEAKVEITEDIATEIMETYVPEQLPVLSGLARHYSVSDYWFCSVPSQTNTNRAFSVAGTSLGLVTNNFYDAHKNSRNPGIRALKRFRDGGSHSDRLPEYPNNLFTLLSDNGVPWKLYWQEPWPPRDVALGIEHQYVRTMFRQLDDKKYDNNFVKFDPNDNNNALFKAAREGRLPALSWIEPKWGGGVSWDSKKRQVGNDMHPVSDTTVAEDFVKKLYDALSKKEDGSENPFWQQTVFVITFDENGGTYDHMPPPAASPTARDKAPFPEDYPHIYAKTRTEFGFKFDQFGIRIPTIIASPYVKPKSVFRSLNVPFDHTSVIATILDWKNIDRKSWFLGERVAQAPLFDHVLELNEARKNDISISSSLNISRPETDTIKYGDEVILEYKGSKWGYGQEKSYLAQAKPYLYSQYPTLSENRAKAVVFKIFADKTKSIGVNIQNMSNIRLASTEDKLGGKNVLSAFPDSHYLYYYRPDDGLSEYFSGERWQVRILSSRDNEDVIKECDDVYFVSQLQALSVQNVSVRTTPDPLQRMVMSPKDNQYLTTKAGEWGIWVIRKAN